MSTRTYKITLAYEPGSNWQILNPVVCLQEARSLYDALGQLEDQHPEYSGVYRVTAIEELVYLPAGTHEFPFGEEPVHSTPPATSQVSTGERSKFVCHFRQPVWPPKEEQAIDRIKSSAADAPFGEYSDYNAEFAWTFKKTKRIPTSPAPTDKVIGGRRHGSVAYGECVATGNHKVPEGCEYVEPESLRTVITAEQLFEFCKEYVKVCGEYEPSTVDGFTVKADDFAARINQFFNGPAPVKHEKAEDGLACVCGYRPDYPQATDKGKKSAVRDHIRWEIWNDSQQEKQS